MKIYHEHDINTGTIFRSMHIKRLHHSKIFNDELIYGGTIIPHLEYILREHNIVSKTWGNLTQSEKAS